MTVSITLQEQRHLLYQLKQADDYDESAELKSLKFDSQQFNGIDLSYSIHEMPGFCLIDERSNMQSYETIDLAVEADCHILSLYSVGKFEITDYQVDSMKLNMAGGISVCSSAKANWGLSVYAGQETHRYIIILTKQYLSAFLANEKWIVNDGTAQSYEDEQQNGATKTAYIDGPIKNILAEISNASYESVFKRAFIELKIKELIFLIYTQRENVPLDSNLPPAVYQKLIRAKAYLLSNYIEAPSILQLSRIISLNQFYLKTYFKGLYGVTIHQFIIQLRMEAAKSLLMDNCSVLETSARTGYRSTSHFITVFKSYYGKTPKQATKDLKL
jgi:AraC-like DNA-binding protein